MEKEELKLELQDNEWPFTFTDHDRMIVRAVVTDGKGRFFFMRAVRDDDFGKATLIETSGGGVEQGENPEDAIRRELKEETGLTLTAITDVVGSACYAIGFSNESNILIIGTAEGEFAESSSAEEEIVPGWFTKEEIKTLLKTERFAARAQAYCYLWSRM